MAGAYIGGLRLQVDIARGIAFELRRLIDSGKEEFDVLLTRSKNEKGGYDSYYLKKSRALAIVDLERLEKKIIESGGESPFINFQFSAEDFEPAYGFTSN